MFRPPPLVIKKEEVAYLVQQYLHAEGFHQSAAVFQVEAKAILASVSSERPTRNLTDLLNEYLIMKSNPGGATKSKHRNNRSHKAGSRRCKTRPRRKSNPQRIPQKPQIDAGLPSLPSTPPNTSGAIEYDQEEFKEIVLDGGLAQRIANAINKSKGISVSESDDDVDSIDSSIQNLVQQMPDHANTIPDESFLNSSTSSLPEDLLNDVCMTLESDQIGIQGVEDFVNTATKGTLFKTSENSARKASTFETSTTRRLFDKDALSKSPSASPNILPDKPQKSKDTNKRSRSLLSKNAGNDDDVPLQEHAPKKVKMTLEEKQQALLDSLLDTSPTKHAFQSRKLLEDTTSEGSIPDVCPSNILGTSFTTLPTSENTECFVSTTLPSVFPANTHTQRDGVSSAISTSTNGNSMQLGHNLSSSTKDSFLPHEHEHTSSPILDASPSNDNSHPPNQSPQSFRQDVDQSTQDSAHLAQNVDPPGTRDNVTQQGKDNSLSVSQNVGNKTAEENGLHDGDRLVAMKAKRIKALKRKKRKSPNKIAALDETGNDPEKQKPEFATISASQPSSPDTKRQHQSQDNSRTQLQQDNKPITSPEKIANVLAMIHTNPNSSRTTPEDKTADKQKSTMLCPTKPMPNGTGVLFDPGKDSTSTNKTEEIQEPPPKRSKMEIDEINCRDSHSSENGSSQTCIAGQKMDQCINGIQFFVKPLDDSQRGFSIISCTTPEKDDGKRTDVPHSANINPTDLGGRELQMWDCVFDPNETNFEDALEVTIE